MLHGASTSAFLAKSPNKNCRNNNNNNNSNNNSNNNNNNNNNNRNNNNWLSSEVSGAAITGKTRKITNEKSHNHLGSSGDDATISKALNNNAATTTLQKP